MPPIPTIGTMREVSGVTSSIAVSERSIEVEAVAFSVDSSHWSGSTSPSVLLVSPLLLLRERSVRMRTIRPWAVRLSPSA